MAKDYTFSFECFDCPFCGKTITPPHVKRHVATHADVSKEDADIAWVRWLVRTPKCSACGQRHRRRIRDGRPGGIAYGT